MKPKISDPKRLRMLNLILDRGVSDPAVLEALARVPREKFVPPPLRDRAYYDGPLPIGLNQTISQPYIVAVMTELLRPAPHKLVLEVGTGSGYQAAVLAHCFGKVVSIERLPALAAQARDRLNALGMHNVTVIVGDGSLGFLPRAPYDAIIVTAAGPSIPPNLKDQLKPGGRLVIPVGPHSQQELMVVERRPDGSLTESATMRCVFVPLRGAQAWPEA